MYAGYIKIHRQLLEWEWYGDTNTMRVFLHLLLSANWKNGMFKGVEIPRGNLVTSLSKLSQALRLTERQIRTAIEHLKKSGTIAVTTYSKFSVIEVLNYDLYQDNDSQSDRQNDSQEVSQTTGYRSDNASVKCQSNDRQTTTIEEYKKVRKKEVKKEEVNNSLNTCAEQVVITLPLTGKDEHPITQKQIDQFVELYPAVDIMQELRNMKGWLISNPERRKTKRGILRFVTNWLSRAQNNGSRGKSIQGRQDVLPDYYVQMKSGEEKEAAKEPDFDREEFEEIRRKLKEQEG